ncbi:hypothetical protein BST61_g5833 [Cercospora zeina]
MCFRSCYSLQVAKLITPILTNAATAQHSTDSTTRLSQYHHTYSFSIQLIETSASAVVASSQATCLPVRATREPPPTTLRTPATRHRNACGWQDKLKGTTRGGLPDGRGIVAGHQARVCSKAHRTELVKRALCIAKETSRTSSLQFCSMETFHAGSTPQSF